MTKKKDISLSHTHPDTHTLTHTHTKTNVGSFPYFFTSQSYHRSSSDTPDHLSIIIVKQLTSHDIISSSSKASSSSHYHSSYSYYCHHHHHRRYEVHDGRIIVCRPDGAIFRVVRCGTAGAKIVCTVAESSASQRCSASHVDPDDDDDDDDDRRWWW